jgi:hypothetical protein
MMLYRYQVAIVSQVPVQYSKRVAAMRYGCLLMTLEFVRMRLRPTRCSLKRIFFPVFVSFSELSCQILVRLLAAFTQRDQCRTISSICEVIREMMLLAATNLSAQRAN